MSRALIQQYFPHLKKATFYITSPQTPQYNCIAWAAGDTLRWWWPIVNPPTPAYWPPGVDRRLDQASFIAAFATLGFAPCADGEVEANAEKVALFADAQGVPTHAAKLLPNGRWSSKLGTHEDIEHTLFGLEGVEYGSAVQFLRRDVTKPAVPNA